MGDDIELTPRPVPSRRTVTTPVLYACSGSTSGTNWARSIWAKALATIGERRTPASVSSAINWSRNGVGSYPVSTLTPR